MHLKPIKFIVTIMLLLAVVLILSDLSAVSNKSSMSISHNSSILLDDVQKQDVELSLLASHQASHFNHNQQRNIEYIFVVLLALFIRLFCVNIYQIKTVHSPPWFFLVRISTKSRLSGWKESNLLYKAKLTYQN